MTAAQLARRGVPNVLLEGSGRMNRGVAYSTTEPMHLLNVPSGKMGAWPDQPADFAQWLGDDGTSFAQRGEFGRYLDEIAQAHGERIERRAAAAVSASPDDGRWVVELDDGTSLEASALVLANGNQPPEPLRVGAGLPAGLFVNDPWSDEAKAVSARVVAQNGDVLILGTGLTMIDTVLALAAAGHEGQVVALSRRGLIPRSHAPHQPATVELGEVPAGRVLPLSRWLRRRSTEVGFRAAVDSLRPHSRALWQALPLAEQRRFLRHARPWWDVHRHRVAPQIGQALDERIGEGRLEIAAGRIASLHADGDELVATLNLRGRSEAVGRRFAAAFNCTGPLGEMSRTRDPLLRQLLRDGLVRLDGLGIGLAVDERSRAGERSWAMGPLTRGCFWEITAVPDVRGQAEAVAADIARELEG